MLERFRAAADLIAGIEVTCIDNGMPVVVRAEDPGISGYENREALDADGALKERLEAIRRQAGPLMNLGDQHVHHCGTLRLRRVLLLSRVVVAAQHC